MIAVYSGFRTRWYGPEVAIVAFLRVTTVSVRLWPSVRNTQIIHANTAMNKGIPSHLSHSGTGSLAQSRARGSKIHQKIAIHTVNPVSLRRMRIATPS